MVTSTASLVQWLACSATDPKVLGSNVLSVEVYVLGFSVKKFLVAAENRDAGGVTPP